MAANACSSCGFTMATRLTSSSQGARGPDAHKMHPVPHWSPREAPQPCSAAVSHLQGWRTPCCKLKTASTAGVELEAALPPHTHTLGSQAKTRACPFEKSPTAAVRFPSALSGLSEWPWRDGGGGGRAVPAHKEDHQDGYAQRNPLLPTAAQGAGTCPEDWSRDPQLGPISRQGREGGKERARGGLWTPPTPHPKLCCALQGRGEKAPPLPGPARLSLSLPLQ